VFHGTRFGHAGGPIIQTVGIHSHIGQWGDAMRIIQLHIAIWRDNDSEEIYTKVFQGTGIAARYWIMKLAGTNDWPALLASVNMVPGRLVKIQQTFMYI